MSSNFDDVYKCPKCGFIAPGRDTVIWITPVQLRALATKMEKRAKLSKGHFGCCTIGSKRTGCIQFQYQE
jgi:hypothetical protein